MANLTYGMFGVWPDGLAPSYLSYSTQFSNVLLGTHMANDPMVAYGTYGYTYLQDWTFNLDTDGSLTVASYASTYGYTYAATYYRNTYTNIRSIKWI